MVSFAEVLMSESHKNRDEWSLPTTSVPKERPGKPGGRRDKNRRERVKALSDAATKLFLTQGIDSTTIDDITKSAGVSKGSFYRYFESKHELVDHLVKPVARTIKEAFDRCEFALERTSTHAQMMDAYQTLGADLTRMMMENSEVVLVYLQECRAPGVGERKPIRDLADAITKRTIDLTRLAHERNLIRNLPTPVSALAVVGAIERLIFGVLTEEDVGDVLQIPEAFASMMLDGILGEHVVR